MSSAPQTQFYKSLLVIGTRVYPALPGCRMSMPLNYDVPPIIGNYWQWNYGPGLVSPTVEVQLVMRDTANECFDLSFFQMFLTRSNDAAHDTAVISGGITFWNGRRGFTLNGAKADSFSIGSGANQSVTLSCRFVGTSLTPVSTAPAFTGFSNATELRFPNVSFAEPFANAVWNFNMSFANNHNPDLSMNGTAFATAMNAGMQTAGFSCLMQAYHTPATLGIANGTYPAPATPTPIAVSITCTTGTRVFTLANPIINNPNDLMAQAPRNMNEYSFICLGADGIVNGPLAVT